MSQRGKLTTDSGLNTPVYCERDLSGGDQFNQDCVNSFRQRLEVTDVCLYENTPGLSKVPGTSSTPD